jgi:Co/Zn/Cd efflux system component
VGLLHSPWPDIIVGAIIAALFLRSSVSVIRSSLPSLRMAL